MGDQFTVQTRAAEVTRRGAPTRSLLPIRPHPILQRKCACGSHTNGGECEQCAQKKGSLQRKSVNERTAGEVPPIVHEVLRSPGQPLDANTRAFMEPRFGHDFSQVRVHTDARAAESARMVNALAYTVGRDIMFGDGQYKTGTSEGKCLLAHELAHVVQQNRGKVQGNVDVSQLGDPFEREAGTIASSIMNEHPAAISKHSSRPLLQRQPKPTAPTPPPSCTPRTGLSEYGCYCGAGTSCTTDLTCTPADDMDACCQAHDRCYSGCSFSDRYKPWSSCYRITRNCDAILCSCVRALAGRFTGDSEGYRKGIMAIFCPSAGEEIAGFGAGAVAGGIVGAAVGRIAVGIYEAYR